MQNLSITLDFDTADKFMIAMLRNTGDTAIWCIRQAHKNLASGGGTHNWTDIGDNLKILGAVNELLEYYGGTPLDLATHETEKPV
jgi:hypothetical protein